MCAAPMAVKLSGMDAHPREVCSNCGYVHYVNPLPVVGTVPVWGDKVLLCRRAIEPRKGFWTLPAGFIDYAQGNLRLQSREELRKTEI